MLDYLLTWGGIYLPIGVVFFLLALEKDGGDLVAFILCGILFSFLGLMAMSKAWDKVKAQEEEEKERFKELITEIRGIRQGLGTEGAEEDEK
ncbi:hypothetical protein ES703_77111 [subsurface metagenome]